MQDFVVIETSYGSSVTDFCIVIYLACQPTSVDSREFGIDRRDFRNRNGNDRQLLDFGPLGPLSPLGLILGMVAHRIYR